MGGLSTRKKLFEVLHLSDKMCPLCHVEEEDEVHLFQKCVFSQMDWLGNIWGFRINSIQASSKKELMSIFIDPPPQLLEHRVTKEQIHLIGSFDKRNCVEYKKWSLHGR